MCGQLALAQTETPVSISDTTSLHLVIPPGNITPTDSIFQTPEVGVPHQYRGTYSGERNKLQLHHDAQVNPYATHLPRFSFHPGQATLFSWGTGGIHAAGSRENLPGLMGIESGSLNFRQQLGNLTLTLFGSAEKYGYYRGLSTIYGFGGSLSYALSDNVGVTLFGSYYTSAGIKQPAMAGYVSAPVFGGYVDWRIHPHWGVKVGAQSYRSVFNGRWEAQPIAMPYYRTSGGAEIGVDLGGILYQVIHQASGKQWGNPGNPSIGRPDFGPPPIRPHH